MELIHPSYVGIDWTTELDLLAQAKKSIVVCVQNTFFNEITLSRLVSMQKNGAKWGLIVDEFYNLIQSKVSSIQHLNKLKPSWRFPFNLCF